VFNSLFNYYINILRRYIVSWVRVQTSTSGRLNLLVQYVSAVRTEIHCFSIWLIEQSVYFIAN